MADFFSNLDGVASLGGLIPAGAEELLNKPTITEDLTTSDNQILPDLASTVVAKTIVFTAPVACTIRNLVGHIMVQSGTSPLEYTNWNYANMIGTITIAGTGPDVGAHVEGTGIPGAIFAVSNILTAPQLNFRLDAGDTVSFTLHNITGLLGSQTIPYNYVLTYDEGQDASVKPTHFIGGPTASGHLVSLAGAVASTGTITVTLSTVAIGETIKLSGWSASGFALSEIGGTLTSASGGGGTGTNTWDSDDDATIAATRDAILAALSDAGNDWDGDWSFAASGGDAITVTRAGAGSLGNADTFLESSANLSVSGSGFLTGGVGASISSSAFAIPSVGVTLDRLHMVTVAPGLGVIPPAAVPSQIVVTALNVGGTPTPSFGQGQFALDLNRVEMIRGSVVVPASSTLSVDAHTPYSSGFGYFVLSGVVT